ncbi:uncharacterized protein LOC144124944 isoform X1 [Amblyomma americanum]
MSSMPCTLSGASCELRNECFYRDRRLMRAEAGRRNKRLTVFSARRHINTTGNQAAEESSDDDDTPFTRRLKHWKEQKKLRMAVATKQKAPFRPPSREPSPLPPPSDYASFRKQHTRYYDSIRQSFSSTVSSSTSCADRHAGCKASKESARPPWDDSTQVSFAPLGFQFQCQPLAVKRTGTAARATGRAKKSQDTKVKAEKAQEEEIGAAAPESKNSSLKLPDFTFLFEPARFSLLFTDSEKTKMNRKASTRSALASLGTAGSATQSSTKLGGPKQRRLALKENTPAVKPEHSLAKPNGGIVERQALHTTISKDKENDKSGYNLRRAKAPSTCH